MANMQKIEQLYKAKTLKQKKCKYSKCQKLFTPQNKKHICCDWKCAVEYQKEKEIKRKLQVNRKALKEFRDGDIPHLTKLAQQAFNKYIRKRDEHLPCISCGHTGNRQRHAGHFRPVGRNHQMRFNEDNAHSQCSICNNHLSGNLVLYREALILKIGITQIEALENNNDTKSYTVKELQEIILRYKTKYKGLE